MTVGVLSQPILGKTPNGMGRSMTIVWPIGRLNGFSLPMLAAARFVAPDFPLLLSQLYYCLARSRVRLGIIERSVRPNLVAHPLDKMLDDCVFSEKYIDEWD